MNNSIPLHLENHFIGLKILVGNPDCFITDSANKVSLGLYIHEAGKMPSLDIFPPVKIVLIPYLVENLFKTARIAISVGSSISAVRILKIFFVFA